MYVWMERFYESFYVLRSSFLLKRPNVSTAGLKRNLRDLGVILSIYKVICAKIIQKDKIRSLSKISLWSQLMVPFLPCSRSFLIWPEEDHIPKNLFTIDKSWRANIHIHELSWLYNNWLHVCKALIIFNLFSCSGDAETNTELSPKKEVEECDSLIQVKDVMVLSEVTILVY